MLCAPNISYAFLVLNSTSLLSIG